MRSKLSRGAELSWLPLFLLLLLRYWVFGGGMVFFGGGTGGELGLEIRRRARGKNLMRLKPAQGPHRSLLGRGRGESCEVELSLGWR